jgi:phosphoribosylanthranilate isomerase
MVRIKICGITNVADALAAAALGADAIGLNFYHGSKRHVSVETARAIIRALPPFVEPVGLYVNQPIDEIFHWAVSMQWLPTFQIHADFHELLPDMACRWIMAFPVRDASSLAQIDEYLERCRHHGRLPDALLVDAHVAGEYGGTGRVAPWELLAGYRPPVPLILAGGLTPDNVAEAVRIVRPYAVDVASGVESSPGQKDVELMRRFIEQARAAVRT